MDIEGLPVILTTLNAGPDKEDCDSVKLQFNIEDGFRMTINAYDSPNVTVSMTQVDRLVDHARLAEELYKDWATTLTGKAWAEKYGK